MAEMAVAAANYSVNALAYWALGDSPPEPNGTCKRWGAFRWTDEDSFSARYHWYALGALIRAMRGPSDTHVLTANDPHLRATALRTHGAGLPGQAPGQAWSIVAVLRRPNATLSLRIALPATEDTPGFDPGLASHKYG